MHPVSAARQRADRRQHAGGFRRTTSCATSSATRTTTRTCTAVTFDGPLASAAGRPRAGRVRRRASAGRDRRYAGSEQHREQSLQPDERHADARRGQRQRGVHGDRGAAARRQAGRQRADDQRLVAVHGLRLVRLRQHVQARPHVQPDRVVLAARHAGHVVPRPGAVRAVPGPDERLPEPGGRSLQQLRRAEREPGAGANCASEGLGVRISSRRAAFACSARAEPRRASRPRPPTT